MPKNYNVQGKRSNHLFLKGEIFLNRSVGDKTAPAGIRQDIGSATLVLEFWLRKNSVSRLKL